MWAQQYSDVHYPWRTIGQVALASPMKNQGCLNQYADSIKRSIVVNLTPQSDIPIPVSKLVKGLGVQADNMFSPFAQCTEAAKKARRLIFMIRRSFQDLLELASIPFKYGKPACSLNLVEDINHLERIQW